MIFDPIALLHVNLLFQLVSAHAFIIQLHLVGVNSCDE